MNITNSKKRKTWWRPILLMAIIFSIFILGKVLGLNEKFAQIQQWIASLGLWGPIVFSLLYIIAVLAALPGSAITIAAGALFGSIWGIILVSFSSTLGAGLAFLIARYFARTAVVNWLSTKEKFQKLDNLTEKHGAIIVALTRLVPLFPFNLLNYGFGLTRVNFWIYLFWSWLCMLPGTILYVVGADAFSKALAKGETPWVLIVIFNVMLIIVALLVWYARKKLQTKE